MEMGYVVARNRRDASGRDAGRGVAVCRATVSRVSGKRLPGSNEKYGRDSGRSSNVGWCSVTSTRVPTETKRVVTDRLIGYTDVVRFPTALSTCAQIVSHTFRYYETFR